MVKTILHEVCKSKGRDIYNYTSKIPGSHLDPAHRPHIFPYIDLNLSTMGISSSGAGAGAGGPVVGGSKGGPLAPVSLNVVPNQPPNPAPNQQASQVTLLPPAKVAPPPAAPAPAVVTPPPAVASEAVVTQQQPQPYVHLAPSSPVFSVATLDDLAARNILASIFKRIAEKDTQAIIDLYFFKEANPGQDIDGMLSSASTTFKSFITRGLHKVKIQATAQKQTQPLISPNAVSQAVSAAGGGAFGPADGEAVLSRTTPPQGQSNLLVYSQPQPLVFLLPNLVFNYLLLNV